jgi:23S rRNA (adenine2030-N6)-methyltransferase
MIDGLARATRRFPGGTYMLWHPIKADSALAAFDKKLIALGRPRTLTVRLMTRDNSTAPGLNGTGLVIINPPYTLEAELRQVLPELVQLAGAGPGRRVRGSAPGRRELSPRAGSCRARS